MSASLAMANGPPFPPAGDGLFFSYKSPLFRHDMTRLTTLIGILTVITSEESFNMKVRRGRLCFF